MRSIAVVLRFLALFTAALWVALPQVAQAHGLVGRRDLPVPAWLFAWAAAVVLVVSFMGLGALWNKPRLRAQAERRILRVPAWFEIPLGAAGVALLVLVVVAGFAGVQIDTANFAPTAIYVGLWIGVPFVSLLVGDLYAAINPLRAIGRSVGWAAGRLSGGRIPAALVLPERVGRWPAAALLLLYAWVELAFPGRGDPSQLAALVLAFCVIQGIGMSLYGTDAWLERCDPFAAWFSWVATLSPARWERGTLYLRPPGSGTAKRDAISGDAAIIAIAIGTTTWDGLSGGDLLGTLIPDLAESFQGSLISATWSNALVATAGMVLVVALVGLLIIGGVRGARSPKTAGSPAAASPRRWTTRTLVRAFAPSLVPIGVAYAVGHYVSLLAFQGQALAPLLSNPLGDELTPGSGGWLGTAQWTIDYRWLSAAAIWYLQVAALLAGHVMALILSHDRALEIFPPKRAARSQRSMLVVAIVFTCTGLWLLSSV